MLETLHACTYKQESFSREKGGGEGGEVRDTLRHLPITNSRE